MDFDEKDRAEFELREGDLLVCEGGEIGRCAVWLMSYSHVFSKRRCIE